MSEQRTTVYLATSGEYSDYMVCHVFAKREDAEAYRGADNVEEYELREGPVEVRTWHTISWNAAQQDGDGDGFRLSNPWQRSDLRDFLGDSRRVNHTWDQESQYLTVQGWDLDRVKKVYSEQRAKHLAQQAGP